MYSTSSGTSLERQILTWLARAEALQKLTRYLREKVSETGSLSSISIDSLGFSTLECCRSVTEPLPMSPWHENLMPSLLASMLTVQKINQSAGACALRDGFDSRTAYPTPTWLSSPM